MPLILITGLPSSGKTTISNKLSTYFNNLLQNDNNHKVHIVSDSESMEFDNRNEVYRNAAMEKELRGWLKAETQRYLNLGQIVLLDAASYIKGYRYELYCLTKEAKTQYCVIEMLIEKDQCWSWNEERDDESKYSKDTFEALLMRYESCDDSNRWDSPLFRITSTNQELPFDSIYNIIIEGKPLASNKCTKSLV